MRLRVVCGFGVTIAIFCPTRRFTSVDFPAFGRPRMATNPLRNVLFEFSVLVIAIVVWFGWASVSAERLVAVCGFARAALSADWLPQLQSGALPCQSCLLTRALCPTRG